MNTLEINLFEGNTYFQQPSRMFDVGSTLYWIAFSVKPECGQQV